MDSLRMCAAAILLLVFGACAIINFLVVVSDEKVVGTNTMLRSFGRLMVPKWLFHREPGSSVSAVPVVGGVAGVVGLYVAQIDVASWVRLLPLVLDLGCMPFFTVLAVDVMRRARK